MIDRLDHFKNIRDRSSLGKVLLVFEMGLGNFFLCLAATIWTEMKYNDGVAFMIDRLDQNRPALTQTDTPRGERLLQHACRREINPNYYSPHT